MGEKETFDPKTVGILLTSHPRQQMFWEEGLKSWEGSPFTVLLCYDDVSDEKIKAVVKEKHPGVTEIRCTGRRSGHVGGELSQMQIGAQYFSDLKFRYILKSAADYSTDHTKIHLLWEAIEKRVNKCADGMAGSQVIHIGTTLIFAFADIFYAIMKPYNFKAYCGAAEIYFSRQRHNMNIIRAGFEGGKKGLEDALGIHHAQGQYAHDNKITIEKTWEIGEIYK